ncbi:bifunctional adenosylcobinamide kinase/adenosylcobinamide-phosphate guanylyltransferase [Rubrobacter tropicus]|uniref:Adenosylcobinamide kinase n=1 Tax=Rubrobacter tropicus TaxID=2653851 RepID=A0A6G8Q8P6_9ACTN|nr:bifunctional adenosylcobinamide kinase/adenosylcobinamide-phosphate guanylyltransferase [Rubrobacter tropicus]QIN82823.1 bifunctional adenosylcobinamide kinase/adenosylcobinamide-phosphate guanylyltransferase [Rubrobacter tropicus]
MRALRGSWPGVLPGGRAWRRGKRYACGRYSEGVVGVRALIIGGARSGKSSLAERIVAELGGDRVLYVATAILGDDPDLRRRVALHRMRRPAGWGTVEAGDLGKVPEEAGSWDAVLLDSLTLWASAHLFSVGEKETLRAFDGFLEKISALPTPFVLVSDEVGLGVVPENEAARTFRDALGLINQRAAAVAEEVHLCVAGVGVRIK